MQTLIEKFSLIRAEVPKIPKNGYNSFSNYKYVQAFDAINAIRDLLVKHKIDLQIFETACKTWTEGKNKFCELHCTARFTNIADIKDSVEITYFGQASDTLDKAIYKAKTNGLKYLFTQLFLMVTSDVVDVEQDSQKSAPPKTYGKCTQCGEGDLLLSRSGKNLYCSQFRTNNCNVIPYTHETHGGTS
jgi:hypothetical protein